VWRALLAGESGVGPIEHFDARSFPTTFAAQVKDYRWQDHVADVSLHEGIGRNIGYALGAAAAAWRHAGLGGGGGNRPDPERLGLYLGSGEGVIDFEHYTAANVRAWDAEDRRVDGARWVQAAASLLSPTQEVVQEPNMALSHLALEFDARGPAYNCLTACAASTQAIGEATCILQRGDADVMMTGGAHTMIHPLGVTGFNRLTALSNRNDEPLTASRPFSADRDGCVMGEGAGILILETLDHATRRGATPLAEIAGYGSTADAYRITDIEPTGRGAAAAMRQAMSAAGVEPADVGYISAHGTGTKENDSIETRAAKAVFGDTADGGPTPPPMSSIKSMMGHLIAAAGAVELITTILALRDQVLPPTMNLNSPAPECDLDYVANAARPVEGLDVAISNNFGFGGQNDSLVIKRWTE
jgi:3-oxoacyl-[acyl-carrier-protein] synthase II